MERGGDAFDLIKKCGRGSGEEEGLVGTIPSDRRNYEAINFKCSKQKRSFFCYSYYTAFWQYNMQV
jgi:hypothetical protein